jgi:TolB-like protein/DNA-binding winged helix-turn-helix (wHTH) protein
MEQTLSNQIPRFIRFGVFEVDTHSGELRKAGMRVRLQGQPLQVLMILLDRGGEVVTREEVRSRIWPSQSFGDTDHALNKAIARIREVLDDSAETPRYIETLPRHGYRFIGALHQGSSEQTIQEPAPPIAPDPRRQKLRGFAVVCVLSLLLAVGYLAWRHHANIGERKSRGNRIAVLPFKNLSGDPNQQYFSDGITDEIITDLGRVGSLQVLSATSVRSYLGSSKSLLHIAGELNADLIVEGAALQAGDRVRVTVQLIDAHDDRHLWAQEYDRDLRDILKMQRELAQGVTEIIEGAVASRGSGKLMDARQIDPEAYRLYLKGSYLCFQEMSGSLQKCAEYLRESITKDPTYAPAHAGLSMAYDWMVTFGETSASEGMPKAKAEALKAIELDPFDPAGHTALGTFLVDYEWDWEGAGKEIQRAIDLQPSSEMAHHAMGWYSVNLGHSNDAVREFSKCIELNPLGGLHHAHLAMVLARIGRRDEATRHFQEALEIDPNSPGVHWSLGYSLLEQHRYQESVAEFERARTLSGDGSFSGYLGYAYAVSGRKQDALAILATMNQRPANQYLRSYETALIYAGLGDGARTFQYLDKAYQERSEAMTDLTSDVAFDDFRSDPRFQELIRKVGLGP